MKPSLLFIYLILCLISLKTIQTTTADDYNDDENVDTNNNNNDIISTNDDTQSSGHVHNVNDDLLPKHEQNDLVIKTDLDKNVKKNKDVPAAEVSLDKQQQQQQQDDGVVEDEAIEVDNNESGVVDSSSEAADDQDADLNDSIDDDSNVDVNGVSSTTTTLAPRFTNLKVSNLKQILSKPGILAGIIGGIVIGVLTAILLILFVVYRMRKKDEGSYALEDSKKPLSSYEYRNVPTKEFYA